MRRIITVLLLLAIAVSAVWLLWDWRKDVSSRTDPWRAIPDNSAVVISIPDAWNTWDRFTHTSQLWSAFEQIPAFASAGRLMARTVERMHDDAALRTALTDASMLVCLLPGDDPGSRAVFIATPGSEAETPLSAFSELIGLDAASKNSLLKGDIIKVKPDTALPSLSLCLRDRLWLMSTSTEAMDEVLHQLDHPSALLQDSLFLAVRGTVGGGADAHVLINVQHAAQLLDRWFDPPLMEAARMPAGWAALDVRARPDALLLSGLFAPAAEDADLRSLRSQGTGRVNIDRVLPAHVTALEVWHVIDPANMYPGSGADPGSLTALTSWIDGSAGHARALEEHGAQMEWAIFQTGDIDLATTSIASLCDPAAGCVQQEYRGNLLQQLPAGNGLKGIFGDRFAAFDSAWWTILGDMVIFSPGTDALKLSIDGWNDGDPLAVEPRGAAWEQQITSSFGRMVRVDVGRSKDMIRERLQFPERTKARLGELMSRIGMISVQISPGQHGFFHIVAGVQHAPIQQKESGVLWEVPIDTLVDRAPFIVRNHTNNTNEVLVQDVNNSIHLIGSTGRLLWSIKLDGPILGDVHQIDRFRNGKLQLLFNTADRLYLIDRNGKHVGNFPIRLPEKATVPASVMDYEKDRDYRILLPTVEGRILNYGADGAEVKGWEIPRMNSVAVCPVHHLRIKNKDYLVLADNSGDLHILDRRGKVRERTALQLGASPSVQRIVPGTDILSSYIIWKDTADVLQKGTFEGAVEKLSTEEDGLFTVIDIDGDGKDEVAQVRTDTLTVFRDRQVVFSRSFGSPITITGTPGKIGGSVAIGMLMPSAQRVGLIDADGNAMRGTTVEGTIPPVTSDLNLDGVPEMITRNTAGRIVAHSLNGR